MDTTTKLLLGGAALGGAYFLLKNKAGDTVGLGKLAFKNVGDLCVVDVTVKNNGGLRYTPKMTFKLKPRGYTTSIISGVAVGTAFDPSEQQVIHSIPITLPTDALDGAVSSVIEIWGPDTVLLAEVSVAEAYTIAGYGAEIISYTFT